MVGRKGAPAFARYMRARGQQRMRVICACWSGLTRDGHGRGRAGCVGRYASLHLWQGLIQGC
eukprot:scaffold95191_cov33-Phaeocystis_antarctica.AAC.1